MRPSSERSQDVLAFDTQDGGNVPRTQATAAFYTSEKATTTIGPVLTGVRRTEARASFASEMSTALK